MRELPQWDLGQGRTFISTQRLMPERLSNIHGYSDDQLRGYVLECFRRAYEARRPDEEKMIVREKYYRGFQWRDAVDNRENQVTNLCFALVEQVWAQLTESMPKPEIVAASGVFSEDEARSMNEFAEMLMRANRFRTTWSDGVREHLKHGTCYWQVVVDPDTGIGWPANVLGFDFYRAPHSTREANLDWYIIAGPVPTRWLKARYPDIEGIKPDGIQSPSYEALVKPDLEAMGVSATSPLPSQIIAPHATIYPADIPQTSTSLVAGVGSRSNADHDTTFVIQLYVRDYSKIRVQYLGEIVERDTADPAFWTRTPASRWTAEPACESGWRVIQMTASGLFIDRGSPLDPCFGGMNLVVGRDYRQAGKFEGVGELEHTIPLNRWYNKRLQFINTAAAFEALPVMVMDEDAVTDLDDSAVEPGETIRKRRGTEVAWLKYGGMSPQQYELLQRARDDFDAVSGVHESEYGGHTASSPDAGVAIRELQRASRTRIRGKEGPQLEVLADLLTKCMLATGRKAKAHIQFIGTDGRPISINPETLVRKFSIRWASGTESAYSREQNEERMTNLFQIGAIDPITLIESLDIQNKGAIVQRMERQALIEAANAQREMEQSKKDKGSNKETA